MYKFIGTCIDLIYYLITNQLMDGFGLLEEDYSIDYGNLHFWGELTRLQGTCQ